MYNKILKIFRGPNPKNDDIVLIYKNFFTILHLNTDKSFTSLFYSIRRIQYQNMYKTLSQVTKTLHDYQYNDITELMKEEFSNGTHFIQ